MKNTNLIKLIFVFPLTFSALSAFADFEPKFYCRATCSVIDTDRREIQNLGSVKGYSELHTDEAFDDLQQNCRNLAVVRGLSANKTALIVGVAKVSQSYKSEIHSSQYASGTTQRLKGYQFKNGRISPNENTSFQRSSADTTKLETEFEYEVDFADETSCREVKSNPGGHSKYIGDENPLG